MCCVYMYMYVCTCTVCDIVAMYAINVVIRILDTMVVCVCVLSSVLFACVMSAYCRTIVEMQHNM